MTELERDTRDRVIRMEEKVVSIEEKLEKMDKRMSSIETTQGQILDILTQAKGVTWILQKSWPAFVWAGALVISYWSTIKGILVKIGG